MANWYYHKGGQQQGPIDWAALKQLADNGQILPDDMVWQEGMPQWMKASQQKGLFNPASAPPPPPRPPTYPAAPPAFP